MEIKITGRNPENLKENLERVLSVATLICLKGHLPNERELEKPEQYGGWYHKDTSDRYNLDPSANNYWANIRNEGENFIVLEFNIRYDKGFAQRNSLTNLILAWFDFTELIPE